LSTTIEKNKKQYYDCLEKSQSSLDITEWILFFADMIRQAQTEATETVNFSIQKTKYFDMFKQHFSDRQLKTINKMLDSGHKGFEGGMTAKKYMSINCVSKATATRDLQELAQIGALRQIGEGRSVHYQLKLKNN
jgi:Fic family protein